MSPMPNIPSITVAVNAMTPSESAEIALHGRRALTPILSGAISGGIVGVAWIIGIIVWLYKRHRRAARAKAAGYRSYREFLDPPKKQDAFIIPPDPAVIKGQARPGQKFVVEDDGKHGHKIRHANTVPIAEVDEPDHARGDKESVPPGMDHRSSAPSRLPDGAHSPPGPAPMKSKSTDALGDGQPRS